VVKRKRKRTGATKSGSIRLITLEERLEEDIALRSLPLFSSQRLQSSSSLSRHHHRQNFLFSPHGDAQNSGKLSPSNHHTSYIIPMDTIHGSPV